MTRERSRRGRFVAAEAARATVGTLARSLAAVGIPVAPLKGVVLVATGAADPTERELSDVDLLVPADRFEEASRVVAAAGWTFAREETGGRERLFLAQGRTPVDLHREPFGRGRFRLPGADLLARARPDERAFGAPVLLPDPLDLYAHLVGHLADTWLFFRTVHNPGDLALVARHWGLAPDAVAAHLTRCGLAWAAAWVLPLVCEEVGDPFADEVLRALGHHPVRHGFGRAVRGLVPHLPPRSAAGLVPALVLHRDPRIAAPELLRAIGRRLRGRGRASLFRTPHASPKRAD